MMIPPKISIIPCPGEYSKIAVKGFEKASITACTKKLSDLNPFSKFKIWISEKLFGKTFIRMNIDQELILIKINDLAQRLSISKKSLIAAEQDGSLNELISMASEAKQYHVPYSTVLDFVKIGKIENLHYLEYLADSLHLPLSELIEAKQQNKLQDLLQEAQKVEERCYETFEKLDKLYKEVDGQLITKDTDERIQTRMKPEELESIKKVVRSAYKVLAKHPQGSKIKVEQVIPVTKNYRILVESSRDSFKITGLFGKVLGYGGAGVAVHTIDLLEGILERRENRVLKIPQVLDKDSTQIIQEGHLLDKIHDGSKAVLGIQKHLRIIRNVFTGTARHCHLGALYQEDLSKTTLDLEKEHTLNNTDQISLAYQLIHGVYHMHKKNITNGDIKPQNVFCDFHEESLIGPRLYLSDFGGGIDHDSETMQLGQTTTPEYRCKQDSLKSREAYKNNDRHLYAQIEKKADIFATCSVLCSIFTGELPYEGKPASGKFTITETLQKKLTETGLSPKTAQILIQGMAINYEERPDAAVILKAVTEDLAKMAPERSKLLLSLSQPL